MVESLLFLGVGAGAGEKNPGQLENGPAPQHCSPKPPPPHPSPPPSLSHLARRLSFWEVHALTFQMRYFIVLDVKIRPPVQLIDDLNAYKGSHYFVFRKIYWEILPLIKYF